MKSYRVLFVLLLLLCGVVLYAASLDEVPTQRGMVHPDFETMQIAGEPAARHSEILWLGWAFGALVIAIFLGLIDVALNRRGSPGSPSARRTIWIAGAVVELIFLALVLSYRSFMADPLQDLVLWFPKPTAWMMYGIWGVPMVFVALYIVKFEQWILSSADEANFAEIEKQRDLQRLEQRTKAAEGAQH